VGQHYVATSERVVNPKRNPKFHALIAEIVALHESKNHDYASDADPLSNFRRSSSVGVEPYRGIVVRMTDKWSRIEQLMSGKSPKNESLRDSLIDNAVYSLLAVVLLDESEGK
jgi:hypothetical protein